MLPFIIKRILASIPVLLLSSALIFFIIQAAPGDFLTPLKLSPVDTSAQVAALTKQFGLDKPVWQQYFIWLGNMLTGNLGLSFAYQQPVADIAFPRILNSIWLVLLNLVLFYPIAIALGVYGAVRQYSFGDKLSSVILYFLLGFPSFFLALIVIFLVLQVRFATGWDIPLNGMYSDNHNSLSPLGKFWDYLSHMLLPALVLTLISLAGFTRVLRGLMLDQLNADYVRTARSKGLSHNRVIYKHALRNAILPFVAGIGGLLPGLISGAGFVEVVFAYPGITPMLLNAITTQDLYLIAGFNMVTLFLLLIGNALSDILLAVVDPRIKYA